MPTVTGLTADKIFELDSVAIVGGAIQSDGTLVLETRGGVIYNLGSVRDAGVIFGTGNPDSAVGLMGSAYYDVSNNKLWSKQTGEWLEKVQLTTKMDSDLALYYLTLRVQDLEGELIHGNLRQVSLISPHVYWQWSFVNVYQFGRRIEFSGRLTYVGASTITVPDSGNLPDISVCNNLTVNARPLTNDVATLVQGGRTGIDSWVLRVNAAGTMDLTNATPGTTIDNGQYLSFRGNWLLI